MTRCSYILAHLKMTHTKAYQHYFNSNVPGPLYACMANQSTEV